MPLKYKMILQVLLFTLLSCSNGSGNENKELPSGDGEKTPVIYKLEEELMEISDIDFLGEGVVAAVQDEEGVIYLLDTRTGKILGRHPFAEKGDFEGLTHKGNTFFAAKSDGTLYKIEHLKSKNPAVEKIETGLTEYNNVEGLTYDKAGDRLLILCKNKPGRGLDSKKTRAIYVYDLKTGELDKDLVIKISLDQIRDKVADKEPSDNKFHFNPSGMAIHPTSGNLFIIASAGQLLVEMDREEHILRTVKLKQKDFPQPEGITFDPNGGMYISNEGGKGSATLMYFTRGL